MKINPNEVSEEGIVKIKNFLPQETNPKFEVSSTLPFFIEYALYPKMGY